jgi:hypothetical protein
VAIRTIREEISLMIPGRPWPLRRDRPLTRDQVPMPSQDRVGRHDGRDLPQDPSTETAALRGQASALVIGQPDAARQLPFEDPVLHHEVLDDALLVAIEPSGERYQQHLQGRRVGNHSPILPCPPTDRRGGTSAEYSDSTRPT